MIDLDEAIAVLERTPATLRELLAGLPEPWITCDEGEESFSPFDVVGHLIHGERTDWMPRLRRILEHGDAVAFEPFDRFAMLEASRGKNLEELLDTFAELRRRNLDDLRALGLGEEDFARPGLHPDVGPVDLGQLLATWVTHDLGHIAQIVRVMAKRYRDEVGAWRAHIPVLDR